MGRQARFDREQILGAALQVAAESGTGRLSMQEVATVLGAPSGSLYHRYASRDHLLMDLWCHAVGLFLSSFVAAANEVSDPVEAACAAARSVVRWSRERPAEARVLLHFSTSDLQEGAVPGDVVERVRANEATLAAALTSLGDRLGSAEPEDRRLLQICVVDLPYGVVRNRLRGAGRPTRADERLVARIVRAALEDRGRQPETPSRTMKPEPS